MVAMNQGEPALCELIELLIVARDQGETDPASLSMIAEHIASCAACREVSAPTGSEDSSVGFPPGDPSAYQLGPEVARGGMGRIVAARDLRIGRRVAVKELVGGTPMLVARFEREARITARLQHPGIVPIYEIGRWPGGAPFYSMRLVEGMTLKAKLQAAATLEERLELVPAVIAATEAVAFAHANDIIHRDLTPTNILVGDYGETVVIDWGLAKDISRADEDEVDVGPYRQTLALSGITASGSVIGTAAYMPPEQAAGDVVDARADVYALGAILYEVLVGSPPYRATRAEDVLEQVRTAAPRPIQLLVPLIPPDLTSIVTKSMERDPGERYASAKSLADDLRRFQAGQLVGARSYSIRQLLARWLRRHRAVVAITSIALAIVMVLSITGFSTIVSERSRTADASRLAEQRRLEAEGLVSFMLVDLSVKLASLDRPDVLEGVATRVVDYYRSRGASAKLAASLEFLADVHKGSGVMADAVQNRRDAVGVWKALVSEDEPSESALKQYLLARDKLGLFLQEAGRSADAVVEFRGAADEAERLHARFGYRVLRRHVAWAQDRLANALLEAGDLVGSRQRHERAALLATENLADAPGDVDWFFAVDMHVEYGRRMANLDIATSVSELASAAAIGSRMSVGDPHLLQQLSSMGGFLGLVIQYRNGRDEERSTTFLQRLTQESLPGTQNKLKDELFSSAEGYYELGIAALDANDLALARLELATAVGILDQLASNERDLVVKAVLEMDLTKKRQKLATCCNP